MSKQILSVAVPWSLSHYIPLNGFHPLYRALFDQRPDGIEIHAWDNIKLHNRFQQDTDIRASVLKAAYDEGHKLKKLHSGLIAKKHEEFYWPPNHALTEMLPGDIEFHHTAPFPSLKRPFVFHCESFAPVFFPCAQQGSGTFENHEALREYYRGIFANPLCLGIFSHIPETLESLRLFFSDAEIDRKLVSSRIGLSSKAFTGASLPEKTDLSRPKFLFVNSAHQNPANFFKRGGHIVLRFWKSFRASGRDGVLMLRCAKPDEQDLLDYGVDTSFVDAETGDSILWAEDYLANHEMNRLMANAHFFLLPSYSLHSASILQSMTLGAIPVVTDTVGTSTYMTDGAHGIVLQGVRKAIWFTDPDTGILLDRYRRIPNLEDSLVSQLTNRIIATLDTPDAYDKMRSTAMAHARKQFSGKSFSAHFWDSVATLYHEYKQHTSHTTLSQNNTGQSLRDCTLQEDDWLRVFESTTQPMRKIYTGQSVVWELGGAFLHAFGNSRMDLNDWSVLARYFSPDAPKLTFAKTLVELEGKIISFDVGQGKNSSRWLVKLISRILMPFPRIHAVAASHLKSIRRCYKFLQRYRQFRSFKSGKSDIPPDIELLFQNMFGFNIIRYFHKYYAIPQSGGAFIPKKAESGGYSSSFSGLSVESVLRKINKAVGKRKHLAIENAGKSEPELILEGFNGYNIIRLGDELHAVLQSDGAFEHAKLLAGEYTRSFSGRSLNEVQKLILEGIDSCSSSSERA